MVVGPRLVMIGVALFVPAIGARAEVPAFSLVDEPASGPSEIQAAPGGAGGSDTDLAKQLQNPVASLISVPLQSNFDFGFDGPGGEDGWRYTLNVQPVIPFTLNEDWNLITRTIVPFIYQEDVFDDGGSAQTGLGDTVQSFYFSPKQPTEGGLIWAAGPVFR